MENKFLQNKVAMITGGASGMGKSMAIEFAKAGAKIIIGSLTAKNIDKKIDGELANLPDYDELDKTCKELKKIGTEAFALDLDVCSSDSINNFYLLAIKKFGKVDILANAAGISVEQTICGHPDSLWNKVIDVNLNGTYRTIKAVLPGMIRQKWGRIINIASTAANVGGVTSGAYCASKAGVVGLTRCVALEGAPYHVTCNAICPGWTETDFGKQWMSDIAEKQKGSTGEKYIANEKYNNPQKRMIQPQEIANLATFLCKEESLGITGEAITIAAGSLW